MPDTRWEDVIPAERLERTSRLKVPGGWIYRSVIWGAGETIGVAMVFVSEKEEEPIRTFANNDTGRNRS